MEAWKSIVWSLSGQFIRLLITIGTLAVLGRLLTPAEFGLYGLIMVIQALMLPVLDMGLQPAYVKMKKIDENTNHAFFTINMIIGCVFSVLLVLLTPWIVKFYGNTDLKSLLMLFSIVVLLTALIGQPQAVLSREKRFDKIALANTIVVATGAALVIILAWNNFGVWSLLWKAIYESAARLLLLILFSRKSYKIVSIRKIKPYINDIKFGLEIVFSRIINSWVKGIDKLILAKYIPLSDLGGYTRSQQLALMPNGQVQMPIASAAMSYFSRSEKKNKLQEYMALNGVFFLLSGVPCLITIVYGDLLLTLLLGSQWISFGWMLQWLGLLGLGRVYQDMSVFYHIDKKIVKRSTQYVLVSIPIVLIIPVSQLITTSSLFSFVASLSILTFIYWVGALIHTMIRDFPNSAFDVLKMNLKLIIIIVLSIILGFFMKEICAHDKRSIIIVFSIIIQTLITFLMFYLIDKKNSRIIISKIIKRKKQTC